MNGPFYIGATGLRSQEIALAVVANNIANLNTPAFKRSEVRFAELLSGGRDPLAPAGADGAATLSGVGVDASSRVFTQGQLHQTGKPLDLAIDGDGFLELLGPDGQTMLWRGGSLKVEADGTLAAANGMALKAQISVPIDATSISIDRGGKVQALTGADGAVTDIGQLELVRPRDMASLTPQGDGLYRAGADSDLMAVAPGEDGGGVFVQGSAEASNVELADEMVMLLLMQRAYAANAQVVQAGDQLMAIANGLKR